MHSKLYVVVYDSNLTLEQIKACCPKTELVGIGIIPNYQMQFRKLATIVPCPGSYTPAVVWEINHIDMDRINSYLGYPTYYYKEKLLVKLNDGKIVHAVAFILNGGYVLPPSTQYFNTLLQGYKDFGLNPNYLFQILKQSVTINSKIDT
jgi:hypothetical protein